MAITHIRTIENLEVKNDGNDIVCDIQVKWVSSDDSDVERTTIEGFENYQVNSEDVIPDSEGFVAFADLTEEIVLGWIADQLAEERVTAQHTSWINSVLNPPAPFTLNKETPW
jgi:hypothetical protein